MRSLAGRHPRLLARLELLGASVFFALMAVLARRLSLGAHPFTAGQLSVVRFVVGALVSAAAFWAVPGLYRPRDYRLLVTRGISGGLVVVLYFAALARIPAGDAGVLYNQFPVIATLIAWFAFGERPTGHLVAGLLVATAGVVLVLSNGGNALRLGWGQAFGLGSAVFAAISANVIKSMRAGENAPTIFFFFCLAGLPVVAPFALDRWPGPGPEWLVASGMAICALLAQILMTQAYGALSVGEAAVWLQLTPIVQFLLGIPLLGEPFTLLELAGAVAAAAGVAWATALGSRRPPPAAEPLAPS